MCGISVVICKNKTKNAVQLLLKSIEQLQNRGYDSFGLSSIENNKLFNIHKCWNNEQNTHSTMLEKFKNDTKDIKTDVIMGHTRWATHGVISKENTHPHLSMSKKIALVHNGIIENYKLIKDNLSIKHGYHFISQTDSEVIVNLIDYYYIMNKETIESAIQKAVSELSGTYGLAIQCLDTPEKTYIIRNGSPLLIGVNDDYIMATSEVSGFVNEMKSYYTVTNNDLVILHTGEIYHQKISQNCHDISNNEDTNMYYITVMTNDIRSKMKKNICNNENIVLTPAPYNHWTLKEIIEQKESLFRATNNGGRIYLNKIRLGGIDLIRDYIEEIENIILIGCGTSLHACQIGAFYLKEYQCGKVNHICAYDASEFSCSDIPKKGKTLVIMISQSGETMDLHRVMQFVKEQKCLTMGIINIVDSLIAREVDCGIYMNAGRENAVASTKSFTSSLIILKLFSIWFLQEYNIYKVLRKPLMINDNKNKNLLGDGSKISRICQNIQNVIEQVGKLNEIYKYNYEYPFNYNYPFNECDEKLFNSESKIHKIMLDSLNKEHLFILGKGRMECIAKEAALKLKEICYIHAEAYSGSALKHGPFALLVEGFPVIFLIDKENKDKMWNAYQEVKSRKAYCLVITELELPVPLEEMIKIEENGDLQEILYMIVLQHICYYISQLRGINPDKPRNLAKVVTVE
jgi:glucosamine--fructose-6-phosphate aminotransferase (isomerizing)